MHEQMNHAAQRPRSASPKIYPNLQSAQRSKSVSHTDYRKQYTHMTRRMEPQSAATHDDQSAYAHLQVPYQHRAHDKLRRSDSNSPRIMPNPPSPPPPTASSANQGLSRFLPHPFFASAPSGATNNAKECSQCAARAEETVILLEDLEYYRSTVLEQQQQQNDQHNLHALQGSNILTAMTARRSPSVSAENHMMESSDQLNEVTARHKKQMEAITRENVSTMLAAKQLLVFLGCCELKQANKQTHSHTCCHALSSTFVPCLVVTIYSNDGNMKPTSSYKSTHSLVANSVRTVSSTRKRLLQWKVSSNLSRQNEIHLRMKQPYYELR
jgi:hypothetical protein